MRMKKRILSVLACVTVLGSVTFSANAAPAEIYCGEGYHLAAESDGNGAGSEVTYGKQTRKYAVCNATVLNAKWQYINHTGDSKYLQTGGDTAICAQIYGGTHAKSSATLYTSSSPYSAPEATVHAEK